MDRERVRVLVVDDDLLICRSLARRLRGQHEVTIANDGSEALALLEGGQRFDLILCDVDLPRVSGPELVDRLGQRDAELAGRVVLISGKQGVPRLGPPRLVIDKCDLHAVLDQLVESFTDR